MVCTIGDADEDFLGHYGYTDPEDTDTEDASTIRSVHLPIEYLSRYLLPDTCHQGLSLFFNTYRFNIIQPESPYVQFSFTEQLENEDGTDVYEHG